MNKQFELTESHFVDSGYRRNFEIITPEEKMRGLVAKYYKPVKDKEGKRFTIQVYGYQMPSNCPVRTVYEFKTAINSDDPIGHFTAVFGSGIDHTPNTIKEIEMRINTVWERMGKVYMEYFGAALLMEEIPS